MLTSLPYVTEHKCPSYWQDYKSNWTEKSQMKRIKCWSLREGKSWSTREKTSQVRVAEKHWTLSHIQCNWESNPDHIGGRRVLSSEQEEEVDRHFTPNVPEDHCNESSDAKKNVSGLVSLSWLSYATPRQSL